ncbi:MAG TPA: hypothetical protein VNJ54_13730 [Plantibacter sp.]|uniref:hypothetical protein n=1 Tax=unclassified Plantibacter TaxID=2624265 RepID=UPI002C382D4E|nr:hypothetical protein [Plantibacter sp.]
MNERSTAHEDERALARRIAVLMRIGTSMAAVLLTIGVTLLGAGAQTPGRGLITAGCAVLVLLPVARLVQMASHYAHTDKVFMLVSLLVLALVVTGAVTGLGA